MAVGGTQARAAMLRSTNYQPSALANYLLAVNCTLFGHTQDSWHVMHASTAVVDDTRIGKKDRRASVRLTLNTMSWSSS